MYTLYKGNCKDINISNRINVLLTDPPFEVSNQRNIHNTFNGYSSDKGEWDVELPASEWVPKYCDLLTPGGIFICFGIFGSLVPIYQELVGYGMTFQSHIVWHKTNPAPSVHRRMYTHANEIILVFSKGTKWTFNYDATKELNGNKQQHNVMEFAVAKKVLGRNQKPKGLVTKLVTAFSNPGDVILDPFCGVGSLLWPAVELGRNAIGIEENQECIEYLKSKGANENTCKG